MNIPSEWWHALLGMGGSDSPLAVLITPTPLIPSRALEAEADLRTGLPGP